MQLKTDKCNFIHLGRCVKSAAPNIPHDSPWLIFPWSETPIISHEPNSTRMAQRSPRGQFSGHLPLTHHSCGNQPGRGGGMELPREDGGVPIGGGRCGDGERERGWGGEEERGRVGMKRNMERSEGDGMEERWRPVAGPAAVYIHPERHLLQVQLISSFHPQLLEVLTKCFLLSLRPNAGR